MSESDAEIAERWRRRFYENQSKKKLRAAETVEATPVEAAPAEAAPVQAAPTGRQNLYAYIKNKQAIRENAKKTDAITENAQKIDTKTDTKAHLVCMRACLESM